MSESTGPAKRFCRLFALQLVLYAIITWNWRMIAVGNYASIFASDLMFATLNFWVIKKIASSESKLEWAAYTLGGAVGSIVSVYITKKVYGI